jgi:formylglycine-generating enzyme required for sulfatase activity
MHRVEFARSFAMSRFETRHAEFEAFVKETARQMPPCYRDPQFPRTPDHPVICVSVDDAESYVEWLSAKTGAVYRLPSEAEWEYAVRGQADGAAASVYSFGNDAAQLCANANTRVEFCNDGYPNTAPVGSFPPNAFGLFDMHGNVWEFMADCVTTSYDGAPADGATVREGDCGKRIMRGGGWYNASTGHHRSANRGWLGVQMRDPMTGFRVVREIAGK